MGARHDRSSERFEAEIYKNRRQRGNGVRMLFAKTNVTRTRWTSPGAFKN